MAEFFPSFLPAPGEYLEYSVGNSCSGCSSPAWWNSPNPSTETPPKLTGNSFPHQPIFPSICSSLKWKKTKLKKKQGKPQKSRRCWEELKPWHFEAGLDTNLICHHPLSVPSSSARRLRKPCKQVEGKELFLREIFFLTLINWKLPGALEHGEEETKGRQKRCPGEAAGTCQLTNWALKCKPACKGI